MTFFVKNITNYPYQLISEQKDRPNFSKREWNYLNKLKEDKTITIKEVETGNEVVLMNMEYYKNIVLTILGDEAFYERAQHYN